MVKTYLLVSLVDEGYFYENNDPNALDIATHIGLVTGTFYDNTKEVLDNTVHLNYALTKDDKFYFLPGVTIPRIKLKDVANLHNIRTVRDIHSADRIFIGSKTIDKITELKWQYACETTLFLEFIEGAHAAGKMADYYYDKIKAALEFYTHDLVLTDNYTNRLISNKDIPFSRSSEWTIQGSKRFVQINKEYESLIEQLQGKELYAEDTLMEYINGEDAVEIDATMFNTISDMFNSSDTDNHTLAMEIMANSHYKKSLLYLTLLFEEYGSTMYSIKSKSHVNFKALCLYLNIDTSLNINHDDCIDILINKKAATPENMQILLDRFGNRIITNSNSRHFIIKSVTFSSDVDNVLGSELINTIKDDYVAPIEEVVNEPIAQIVEPQILDHESADTESVDFF